jgi:hypothetical protein
MANGRLSGLLFSFASQFGLIRSRRYPQTLCPLAHLAPLAEVAGMPTISIPP